ncbi:hypothetical protein DFP72DRAFT_888735, partial [Ephemerocybe angulata]
MLSTFLPVISTCPRPIPALGGITTTRTTQSLQDRYHPKHPGVGHSTRATTNPMSEGSTTYESNPVVVSRLGAEQQAVLILTARKLRLTPTKQRRPFNRLHTFTGHLLRRSALKRQFRAQTSVRRATKPGPAITSNHKPTAIPTIGYIRTRACKHLHGMEEGGRAYSANSRSNPKEHGRRQNKMLDAAIGFRSLPTASRVWCDFLKAYDPHANQNDYTKRIQATRTLSSKRRPSPTRSHSSNPATPPQRYREPADDDDDSPQDAAHAPRRPSSAPPTWSTLPDHCQQRAERIRKTSGTYRVPDLHPSSPTDVLETLWPHDDGYPANDRS